VSRKPIEAPCLTPVDVVRSRGLGDVYRYRVTRS
jgi:hypothetical protein